MAVRTSYRLIQATEDATARAIGTDHLLVQIELLLRSQFRRGYVDADDFARAMDDIAHARRQIAAHKDELARLRRGEVGYVRHDG
jgi:hypothetical protein